MFIKEIHHQLPVLSVSMVHLAVAIKALRMTDCISILISVSVGQNSPQPLLQARINAMRRLLSSHQPRSRLLYDLLSKTVCRHRWLAYTDRAAL